MISNYITETQQIKIPISFKCDVCGREIVLQSDYDKKYKIKPSDHMAVVTFSYPTGGWGESSHTDVVHCCTVKCLSEFIPKIPFDANITIPMNDSFKNNYNK